MRLISWNVNGLRAAAQKGLFEWMQQANPDILCLQETKLQQANLTNTLQNVDGYTSHWSFAEKKGYSGVATFTKHVPTNIMHGFDHERFNNEGRIITTEFDQFTLFNIYFPNGQMSEERLAYKMDFCEYALTYFDRLRDAGKSLIICGDYNIAHTPIDLKNAKQNENYSGFLPIERAWIDKLISHGYADTFRTLYPDDIKYSWWSYRFNARATNAGWRIDYFFVTDDLIPKVKDAFILNEIAGSDHCPVGIDIEL